MGLLKIKNSKCAIMIILMVVVVGLTLQLIIQQSLRLVCGIEYVTQVYTSNFIT